MSSDSNEVVTGRLGTFSGVFTPSVLTILGIILFLRLGYVVGAAGLGKALIIIAVANLISVLTSFSLAAVSTNMKVGGGGDYYLISRTLGIEFGGAIGIVLFIAQSVSIAFYCIGFGEALTAILGLNGHVTVQLIAGTALLFLFMLAWIGADLATKFQYVVMVFLILALLSFYIGGLRQWNTGLLMENWVAGEGTASFWILFALFFPAVTGFTQGVSMSGDLKDPGKSLPTGTFAAVFISILVYFSVAVVFAASTPLQTLAGDYGAMQQISMYGWLINAGVIAATLSSAMASFLGAPRILKSLASDKIFPILNPFAKGYGPSDNPRRAVLLSFGIAVFTVFMGQLDLIAGVVSMFFLISYGLLNYATYFEASAETPSFRPRFKWYNKKISLVGALICLGVMLAIDFKTGIAAVAILFAIFQYLKRVSGPARWADSRRSYHLKLVRDNLLGAQKVHAHARDWRPYLLVLSNDEEQMKQLLDFSSLVEGKSGITTAVRILQARGYRAVKLKAEAEKDLARIISEKESSAFSLVLSSEYAANGLAVLCQSFGLGPVKANTVLLSWNEPYAKNDDPVQFHNYRELIRPAIQSGCNIILWDQKDLPESDESIGKDKTIDVWWQDDDTSRLMLLLAYLITRDDHWEDAKIRLLACYLDRDNEQIMQMLSDTLDEFRIQAEPKIVLGVNEKVFFDISAETDLVFLPVSLKKDDALMFGDLPADQLLPGLKTVAMVMAVQKIELDSSPEEGRAGELAHLFDELKHAEKRVDAAKKIAQQAARSATDFIKDADDMQFNDPDLLTHIKEKLALQEKSEEANKKVLKEQVKLMEVSQRAKDEGLAVDNEAP
ncbi:amino acid permease [Desulfobacter hydrogenophilus]|uniref:Amino acid permease n=1 Tax=Desulfobacter hydrogenophilus TaxID=2291 RepID=A0A328FHV8_9BACT|nr:amino acid permease [Desulfobacter hydrogenophilus]NDY71239.1 amino acid permease [Desulfobacter hydrogenophilus]QBH15021.1 amino acid permease [Desulfobacter hydrogenophilus]RAM02733.1 amino acid permease [Desulfobacter hydrogenophilus]